MSVASPLRMLRLSAEGQERRLPSERLRKLEQLGSLKADVASDKAWALPPIMGS